MIQHEFFELAYSIDKNADIAKMSEGNATRVEINKRMVMQHVNFDIPKINYHATCIEIDMIYKNIGIACKSFCASLTNDDTCTINIKIGM